MIKRILTYLIVLQLAMVSYALTSFAAGVGNISFKVERSVMDNVIIDEKPGIDVKITIPADSTDSYQMKLITDYDTVEIVPIKNTGTEQTFHFEFDVTQEGYHELRADLIKNGLVYSTYGFEQYYIKSVDNKGYSDRGFCVHYAQGKGTELDARMLKAGGNTVIRDDLSWHGVETEKGVYNFSSYDKTVQLLEENGLDILFILGAYGLGNGLYLDEDGSRVMRTPEQIEAFKNFCVAAVKRYPQVRKWEILNESNFTLTGEEYFNIAYAVSKAMKECDPDIKIYAGGLAQKNAETFVNGFYKEKLYPYIDGLSDHYYSHYRYADNPGFFTTVDTLTGIQKREGGWKDYSITEIGYATGTSTEQVPELKQASENVKKAVLCDWYGMDYMSYYDFKNDGYNLDEREHTFGAVDISNIPKPSYHTVKQYQKATNRAQYIGKAYLSDELTAHLYASNDDYFMIVWANNANPDYNILKENNVSAQYTFSDNVTIEDMYGEYVPGNTLTATYEPSYVFGLSKEFCLNAVLANTADDIFAQLRATALNYGYSIENIETAYNNIFTASDYNAVEEYVNVCYTFAKTLVKDFLNNDLEMSEKAFSNLLSDIAIVSEKGAGLAALMETSGEADATISQRYTALKTTPSDAVSKNVAYINEPYYYGKKFIEKSNEFNEGERVKVSSGDGFELKSDNTMVIKGTSTVDEVLVRIEDGNGDAAYINLIPTDGNGNYYFEYDVNIPYGNYTVKINDGEVSSTDIEYTIDENYISVEDKMYSINYLQAKKLLELYESMLGWADIKYEYSNPDVKSVTWEGTNTFNVTGKISRLAWAEYTDIVLSVYDKKTEELVAVYTTYPDVDGGYRFVFKYDGSADDIKVKVNQGGVIVDNVECRQATESELITGTFELKEDGDAVKVLLDLKNYFELSDRSVQVVIAYYDNAGNMISCICEDMESIAPEGLQSEYTINKTGTYAKIKVFAWNSTDSMSPYSESITIK